MNDNINDLLEGQRIREKLRRTGVYPMVGPRGHQGKQGIAGPPGIEGKVGPTVTTKYTWAYFL